MNKKLSIVISLLAVSGLIGLWLLALPKVSFSGLEAISDSPEAIERGEYLAVAGGCISCHRGQTEETNETYAGGLAIETDFGTFYAPNITPDIATGIGNWGSKDFLLALKHGRTPSGSFYYPAFPYRAYSGIKDQDVLDMAAYLMSLEPIYSETPDPDVPPWLYRSLMAVWNKFADFNAPSFEEFDDGLVNRGAYLARSLGHCGECHTPRNVIGVPDYAREFAGAEIGDEVIEPINAEALEEWTTNNFDIFLLLGLKPEGEFVGGDMNEVIEHNTSKLTENDRDAMAAFFTRHKLQDG